MKENIDYSRLPGSKKLFIDYILDFDSVNMFYFAAPYSDSSFENIAAILKNNNYHRNKIADILESQNGGFDESVQTNIDKFRNEDCFAVVTGQQPGLLTGPLYTIYKSITTVKLAEELGRKLPYKFVPVFWIESNDHDFDEIRKISLFTKDKSLKLFEYTGGKNLTNKPFSDIEFDSSLEAVINGISSSLPESEFKEETERLLRKCCSAQSSPVGSFKDIMRELFKGRGLILFDPSDIEVKRLAGNLFKRIIRNTGKIQGELIKNNTLLENKGYQPAVDIKENVLRLFYHENGMRMRLRKEDSGIRAGDSVFTMEELEEQAENNPERFSPDVLTRPLMQDFLFPTVSYVAGPTEVCYYGQIKSLYETAKISMPVIFPRAGVSITDKRTEDLLEKYSLSPSGYIVNPEALKNSIIQDVVPPEADSLLKRTENELNEIQNRISYLASDIDKTLKEGTENSFKKIIYQFNKIKERLINKLQEKNHVQKRHAERINDLLLPGGQLQERKLNIFSFVSLYGMNIIQILFSKINIYEKKHQVIIIE